MFGRIQSASANFSAAVSSAAAFSVFASATITNGATARHQKTMPSNQHVAVAAAAER
jgi:hypothetical protein